MEGRDNGTPGLPTLVRRLSGTILGAVQNRAELLSVEWQEERAQLMELLIWAIAFVFLALMGVVLLTGTIILLCPPGTRVYATAGFAVLYFAGAVGTWFILKRQLRREPFPDSLEQVKKDRVWLDSLK